MLRGALERKLVLLLRERVRTAKRTVYPSEQLSSETGHKSCACAVRCASSRSNKPLLWGVEMRRGRLWRVRDEVELREGVEFPVMTSIGKMKCVGSASETQVLVHNS